MASLRPSSAKRPQTSPPDSSEEEHDEEEENESNEALSSEQRPLTMEEVLRFKHPEYEGEEDEDEDEEEEEEEDKDNKSLGQDSKSKEAAPKEEPRKKRKYEPRRKKQSLALDARRDFDHFERQEVPRESPNEPKRVELIYRFASEPSPTTPGFVENHSVNIPLLSVGSFWVLRIRSIHKDRENFKDALVPSSDFVTSGTDPSTVWMLRLPISVVKNDPDKGFIASHFEECDAKDAMRTRAPRSIHKKTGPHSWACAVSQSAGIIWRTPEIRFSDVYAPIMTPPSSTTPNKLVVKSIGPFLHAHMDGAAVADITKSKNEISRLLLHWTIELTRVKYEWKAEPKGCFEEMHANYTMRLPIVLDTSWSNAPPRVISPVNGVFDNDQLHMRITFERQTSSFDTLVLRDFSWKVLDRDLLKERPFVDTSGPLGFVSSIPERFYSPRRIPFEMTPMLLFSEDKEQAVEKETEVVPKKKSPGQVGIRAKHYVVVLPGAVEQTDSVKPIMFGRQLEAYEVEFGGSGVSFDANPRTIKDGVMTREFVDSGHRSLMRGFSASSKPGSLFQDGIPFDKVVAVLTAFVYGNGVHDSSPFFWRCFTNLRGILHKTDPELYSLRATDRVLDLLNKDATTKASKNENHRAHYHFDVDGSTVYASSCNLMMEVHPPSIFTNGRRVADSGTSYVQSPIFSRRQRTSPEVEAEDRKVMTGSLFMNVPDFILPKDAMALHADNEEGAEDEAEEDESDGKVKYQHLFVAERLIWALKFSVMHRTAPAEDQPQQQQQLLVNDIGKPLFTIEGEEFYADKHRWESGSTRTQLIQRILQDTRTTEFSDLLWTPCAMQNNGVDRFNAAIKAYKTLILQDAADAHGQDSEEKSLTKVLEELPDMNATTIILKVFAKPGEEPQEKSYRLSPASLAQFSQMARDQGKNISAMNKDSNKIRLPEGLEFYEPSILYIQAIIHSDRAQRRVIWNKTLDEDVARTAEILPQHKKTTASVVGGCLGELTSLMLFDCMRIADFLFSDKLCNIILGQMITESDLYAPDLSKSNLYVADANVSSLVRGMPCQDYYLKNLHKQDVFASFKCVATSFSIFLAIRCICEDFTYNEDTQAMNGLCIRRGMDFVFAGLGALLGPNPNFSEWILGGQFKNCRDQFEGFDEKVHDLLVRIISKYQAANRLVVDRLLKGLSPHEEKKCVKCKETVRPGPKPQAVASAKKAKRARAAVVQQHLPAPAVAVPIAHPAVLAQVPPPLPYFIAPQPPPPPPALMDLAWNGDA